MNTGDHTHDRAHINCNEKSYRDFYIIILYFIWLTFGWSLINPTCKWSYQCFRWSSWGRCGKTKPWPRRPWSVNIIIIMLWSININHHYAVIKDNQHHHRHCHYQQHNQYHFNFHSHLHQYNWHSPLSTSSLSSSSLSSLVFVEWMGVVEDYQHDQCQHHPYKINLKLLQKIIWIKQQLYKSVNYQQVRA